MKLFMNDIVFADGYEEYTKSGQKFDKCLKIFVAERKSDGGEVIANGQTHQFAWGEYAVIAPSVRFTLKGDIEGGVLVCIEQPLLPAQPAVNVVGFAREDMRNAVEAAAYYFKEDDTNILSALGALIAAYVGGNSVRRHPVTENLAADMERMFGDSSYSADAAIRKLPLNSDYVRKLFKKETGITPHEYLNGLRMARARELIMMGISNSYSRYTVAQIAEACGFAEPLYFSRAFKKYFGMSPSAYISKFSPAKKN